MYPGLIWAPAELYGDDWKNKNFHFMLSGHVLTPRQLKREFPSAVIFSTDDYFFTEDGSYVFDPDCLEDAHKWNQKRGKCCLLSYGMALLSLSQLKNND